jgi:hypothetical protein
MLRPDKAALALPRHQMNAACHRAALQERFATWHDWTVTAAANKVINRDNYSLATQVVYPRQLDRACAADAKKPALHASDWRMPWDGGAGEVLSTLILR